MTTGTAVAVVCSRSGTGAIAQHLACTARRFLACCVIANIIGATCCLSITIHAGIATTGIGANLHAVNSRGGCTCTFIIVARLAFELADARNASVCCNFSICGSNIRTSGRTIAAIIRIGLRIHAVWRCIRTAVDRPRCAALTLTV